jgi:hypothetical protein
MSLSNVADLSFADLCTELSARCLNAVEANRLDDIPSEQLGQMFASVVQTFAAKAQDGETVRPFGRNSAVTVTDVAIGCTAMLDSVRLSLFELGAWQAMSNVGRPSAELPLTEQI